MKLKENILEEWIENQVIVFTTLPKGSTTRSPASLQKQRESAEDLL